MSSVADYLQSFADGAAEVAKYSPPPVNVVAGIIAVALKAGAAIAHAGGDPVEEITRILDRHPEVSRVRGEWEDYIAANWPKSPPVGRAKTDPPPTDPAPVHETQPSMDAVTDPYED